MKTTIDIAGPLRLETKRVASMKRTTPGALVEEGLRTVFARRRSRRPFRLRDASFRDKGLAEPLQEGDWVRILDIAHGVDGP